jgi:hypothetical protein
MRGNYTGDASGVRGVIEEHIPAAIDLHIDKAGCEPTTFGKLVEVDIWW